MEEPRREYEEREFPEFAVDEWGKREEEYRESERLSHRREERHKSAERHEGRKTERGILAVSVDKDRDAWNDQRRVYHEVAAKAKAELAYYPIDQHVSRFQTVVVCRAADRAEALYDVPERERAVVFVIDLVVGKIRAKGIRPQRQQQKELQRYQRDHKLAPVFEKQAVEGDRYKIQ